jgi:hypothetical protein
LRKIGDNIAIKIGTLSAPIKKARTIEWYFFFFYFISNKNAETKKDTIDKINAQFQIHSGPNKAAGSSPCQLKVWASNGPITKTNKQNTATDVAKHLINVDKKFILFLKFPMKIIISKLFL